MGPAPSCSVEGALRFSAHPAVGMGLVWTLEPSWWGQASWTPGDPVDLEEWTQPLPSLHSGGMVSWLQGCGLGRRGGCTPLQAAATHVYMCLLWAKTLLVSGCWPPSWIPPLGPADP